MKCDGGGIDGVVVGDDGGDSVVAVRILLFCPLWLISTGILCMCVCRRKIQIEGEKTPHMKKREEKNKNSK